MAVVVLDVVVRRPREVEVGKVTASVPGKSFDDPELHPDVEGVESSDGMIGRLDGFVRSSSSLDPSKSGFDRVDHS